MNYAIVILEAELKSLESYEFPCLIKIFGGHKGQSKRIKDIQDALFLLKAESKNESQKEQ